jgi:hypothetical protein
MEFVSSLWVKYTGAAVGTLFVFEHIGRMSKTRWLRPSVPITWTAVHSREMFFGAGRALGWAFVWLDRIWCRIIIYIGLTELLNTAWSLLRPLWELLISPWHLLRGYGEVASSYVKPYAVHIGLVLVVGACLGMLVYLEPRYQVIRRVVGGMRTIW